LGSKTSRPIAIAIALVSRITVYMLRTGCFSAICNAKATLGSAASAVIIASTWLMLKPTVDAQTRGEMQSLLLSVWENHRPTVVFVTHDIEEALLLADRALVLSHRPSSIRERIEVPWERPRSYDLVLTPEFVTLRGQVRASMHRG
jgi:ABC-type nitrate/sulfonate/bicarbonate transport system ATPase subunit